MLDQPEKPRAADSSAGPALDFQQHLKRLEAEGLVVRIDRPIDKDAELHPLVRWQFQGGLPEEKRRAFLFPNVVDGSGRRYDMPAVVGALSASPQIYAVGMGKPLAEIGDAWLDAVAHPIAPVRMPSAACQEVVIRGHELRQPDGGLKTLPVPISTPGFDASSLSHRHALHHQGPGDRHSWIPHDAGPHQLSAVGPVASGHGLHERPRQSSARHGSGRAPGELAPW